MFPSGVEEGVMLAVAPVVTLERAAGRSGTLSDDGLEEVGLEGKGGEDGEGLSKGVSLSSPSGVDAAESAMAVESEWCLDIWQPATAGSRAWQYGAAEDREVVDNDGQASRRHSGDDASTGESGRRSSDLWVVGYEVE